MASKSKRGAATRARLSAFTACVGAGALAFAACTGPDRDGDGIPDASDPYPACRWNIASLCGAPSPPPPPVPGPLTQPTPQPQPRPSPSPQSRDRTQDYPLNEAQASKLVEAGFPVAGLTRQGLEVLIMKTTETVYKDEAVQKNVCRQEYDYYEKRSKMKCRYETVYEKRPVANDVYHISGGGLTASTRSDVTHAFSDAAVFAGAVRWRRM